MTGADRAQQHRFWRTLGLGAGLLLVTLCAYANSLQGEFFLDDFVHIVDNDALRSPWPIRSLLSHHPSRPLVMLSLAANFALGGLAPLGYHAVNLAIHLAAGLLLFGLVRRTLALLPRYSERTNTADLLAFAVALIWLVHPLQTQSVTYVIQRAEAAMGLLYLACLYCVLRGSRTSRSWPWYMAAVLAGSLGMGAKEVMVTAPLMVLLYDRVFLADSWRAVLERRWGVYLGFLPALAWLVVVTVTAPAPAAPAAGGEAITPWSYLGSQGGVVLHYLRLTLWPDPLCLDYLWPVARTPREILLPGAVVAALLTASLVALRRRPPVGFLGIAFFLILAPTSSILPIDDLAFEHRMYLPLAPLVALLVFGYDALARRFVAGERIRAGLTAALLLVIVVPLALRTFDRNRDYQDPIAMWRSVLRVAPTNHRAYSNLGSELIRRGEFAAAEAPLKEALRFGPDYAEAHTNLAVVLTRRGDLAAAADHLQSALRTRPGFAKAHYNLGNVLTEQGKLSLAMAHLQQALRQEPDYAEAHGNLGFVLARRGRLEEASVHYEHALRVRPDDASFAVGLGGVLAEQGKLSQAAVHLQRALRLEPDNAEAHRNLGGVFARQGDLAQATAHLQRALRLVPDNAEAHNNLGVVLLRRGDLEAAASHLEAAIRATPRYAEAHSNLGNVRVQQRRSAAAVRHYRRALQLQPELLGAANGLAWILATSPDASLRDGAEAVRWAERCAQRTRRGNPAVLDTLAAAYAEAGRWSDARSTAEAAVALSSRADPALAEPIRARLELFEQQKPFREAPRGQL